MTKYVIGNLALVYCFTILSYDGLVI